MHVVLSGLDLRQSSVVTTDMSRRPARTTSEQLVAKLDEDLGIRLVVERHAGPWGWGITGWYYDGPDSEASQAALISDPLREIEVFVDSPIHGRIQAPDVGNGALSFLSDEHFKMGSAQIYAFGRVAQGERNTLELTGGLRFGWLSDTPTESLFLREGTSIRAFRHGAVMETDLLTGPELGLRARARFGRHRLEGAFSQAMVYGNADHRALFTEDQDGEKRARTEFRTEQTVTVPITELRVGWSWNAWRNLSIGAGILFSAWWDIPVGTIGQTPVTSPQLGKETLTVFAPMLVVEWRSGWK
jgi:hypothetical protein